MNGEDALRALGDRIAVQDEHSHGDRDARRRIARIVLDHPEADDAEIAARLARELRADDLAAIVADWLDSRTTI